MKRTHLGIQAIIVMALVSFASWPQFRPVRAQTIWRYTPSAALEARTSDAARYAGRPAAASHWRFNADMFASSPRTSTVQSPFAQDALLEFTPDAVAVLGGKDNALVGLAQNSLNAAIPYARVVLRDIRTGRALQQVTADELGRFSFVDLAASDYVVELLGPEGSAVAASPMVTMSKGQLQQTLVRVAVAAAAIVAFMGYAMSPSLPDVTAMASSNGVTRTTTTLIPRVTSTGN